MNKCQTVDPEMDPWKGDSTGIHADNGGDGLHHRYILNITHAIHNGKNHRVGDP